jgi:hypothetical protein
MTTTTRDSALTARPDTLSIPAAPAEDLVSLFSALVKERPGLLIGSAAALIAVGFVAARAFGRKPARLPHESSGVLGTIVKSALFASIKTISAIELTRLGRKILNEPTAAAPQATSPTSAAI